MHSRKKTKSTVFLAVLFCFVLFYSSFAAEEQDKPARLTFSVLPTVGYHSGYTFGQLLPLPGTADVPEISVQSKSSGIVWGIVLGCRVADNLEFQGLFLHARSEFQEDVGVGVAGIPLGVFKLADVNSSSYSGNIQYSLPFTGFEFFVTAGAGAIRVKPDGLTTKTGLLLNGGGGVALNPAEHLRLFLDVRDFVSFFDFVDDFGLIYAEIYEPDFRGVQHSLGIHFGLGYLF